MDKAPDFGSGDCKFESCHGRFYFVNQAMVSLSNSNQGKRYEQNNMSLLYFLFSHSLISQWLLASHLIHKPLQMHLHWPPVQPDNDERMTKICICICWVGHHNLFPEEDLVRGGSQSPSKALAGQAGGDRPGSRGSSRAAQLFSQPWEDLGQPEEGGPAEQTPGESTFETRAFQNWLNLKSAKKKSSKVQKMKILTNQMRNPSKWKRKVIQPKCFRW